MLRRLAPLALLLAAACGREEAPVPVPASGTDAVVPAGAPPTAPSPASPRPPAPSASPGAARPNGDGVVGTWTVDPEARQAAIADARKRVDAEIKRRLESLPAEKRARATGFAEAAAGLTQRAIAVLEKVEITLEVKADGTASYGSQGLGPDRTTACTWVEEGGHLVLTRTDAPEDEETSDRQMRFRHVGDVLEWERPVDEGSALGRVPITLRRR